MARRKVRTDRTATDQIATVGFVARCLPCAACSLHPSRLFALPCVALHLRAVVCVRRGERTGRDGRQLVGSVAGADCILVDDQIFSGARQSLRGTLHATCNLHHD